ncbi:MAG: hypothetical protein QM581_06420 [Pseudomonas sp.]
MPGLTGNARILAASEGCPRQIVEYGSLVYGGIHPRRDRAVDRGIRTRLAALAGHRFVQQPEALRGNDYADMNQKLSGFLDRLMQAYAGGV